MRKNLSLAFGMLLLTQVIWSQTISGIISGKGKPLAGATIKVTPGNKTAFSANDGSFQINLNSGNYKLTVSSIGYDNQTINVLLSASESKKINISLQEQQTKLEDVVVIGSRKGGRVKTESAVPIDVINLSQASIPSGRTDLTSVLNYVAPSFNYNKQSGADGADHIELGTLRGLGPDQTLVLINGKRRHQTAFVALFGTRGRGASGSDLNSFPQSAVDKIEILRDGASAQYGSDAIAGVMNIILKKDVNHWNINTGWSGYYDTKFNARKGNANNDYYAGSPIDGNTFTFSANNGVAIGKNGGFINFSFDFASQGKTYRQVNKLVTSLSTNPKDELYYVNSGRRAFGDASMLSSGLMYNMEIPLDAKSKTVFYSFGAFNNKNSDAYAYSRNYSARPERFPTDANGNLIFDPSIMRKTNDGEVYYNPHIQTKISDLSVAAGFRGTTNNDWNWDFSNTLGRNNFHFFGDKTYNASIIGATSPNHFDDGGFNFLQNTTNLDFSKSFKSIAEGLNIGFGAEFRYEKYGIFAGEVASYKGYTTNGVIYQNLVGDGYFDSLRTPAPGSQGFPGFSPNDVISAHRTNVGGYIDAELNITKLWLADAAIRVENYSDFGFVKTLKLASRYKLSSNFNLRGSVSTGFRAPSLPQINFSNTLTSFSGGQLVQSRIANNNDPITKAVGIPGLKEETSVNASLGFSWKPTNNLTFTIDGYSVKVKDRIILSGLFSADDPTLPASVTSQLNTLGVATAQFFSNAVNTTNTGIDVVVDYNKKWNGHSLKILLAGNFQKVTIDKVNIPTVLNATKLLQKTFFSDREEAFLKASAPGTKLSFNLDYSFKKWSIGTHITYFGKVSLMGFGTGTDENPYSTGINPMVPSDANENVLVPEVFNYMGKATTDIYTSYKISKKVSIFAGADNLFNLHPHLGVNPLAKGWAGDNESGGPWDSVQMGFNGRRLFTKLIFNF